MIFAIKLFGYFLLWTLWSYAIHALAHSKLRRRFNLVKLVHVKHHAYDYGASKWPPWHDYLFWFGDWRSSMDIYIMFTIPLIVLTIFDPAYGGILLGFHYFYELFLARNVLDHNPDITGPITKVLAIGNYHLGHHREVHCNFSFFFTFWDHVFGTTQARLQRRRARRKASARDVHPLKRRSRFAFGLRS
jgi:sterol desaturase/sphingolipid hydroxylase (fatty acid hydroxylase superfamily)